MAERLNSIALSSASKASRKPHNNPYHQKLTAVFAVVAEAYSPATLRGYRADLHVYLDWCIKKRLPGLPAKPATVAQFVDHQIELKSVATVKRRLCAIAFAHSMLDLDLPTKSKEIQLALRRARRKKLARPKQVHGLTHAIKSKVVAQPAQDLAQLRDAALISVGYDTLCRSSELASMRLEHIDWENEKILVPRSKADAEGVGRIAYLSPTSVTVLRKWVHKANLKSGPLFRSLHLQRLSDQAFSTASIRRLVKRAAARAGIERNLINVLSGHSMRVGAAQDMLAAGFDALAIMQAGGWKSANVVLRYIENASTKELHERRWQSLKRLSLD